MTGWLWILADVVGVAILGGFLFYGQRQTAKCCAVKRPAAGLSCLPLFAQRGAVALSLYLLIDASRRIYDLGPCSGTPGDLAVPTTPTKKERSDAEQAGRTCKGRNLPNHSYLVATEFEWFVRARWTHPRDVRRSRQDRASIWAGMISGELVPDVRRLSVSQSASGEEQAIA